MAIYHFSAKIIGRSAGRSSVAASAYRAGAKMTDARTGEIHDFTRKGGVFHSQVMAPAGAPAWMLDRDQLWNRVESTERRKDAQLCREFNVALPKELDQAQQIALARQFVQTQLVNQGMVVQLDLHDLDSDNPHFHAMATQRDIDGDGFGKKNRDWNSTEQLSAWREGWADMANQHLAKAGQTARIDHRSLADQGITDREPTRHLGVHAIGFEKRTGVKSNLRLQMEADMRERAQEAAQAKIAHADLDAQIDAAEVESVHVQRDLASVVAPARASADLRRDLDQVQSSLRPAGEVVADQPAVKAARERLERSRREQDQSTDKLVMAKDKLKAAKRAARLSHSQVEQWKKDHPWRYWLHQHVHQSSTLRRLESQAVVKQKAIEPAQRLVKTVSAAASKVHQAYVAARDHFTDINATAVNRLEQARRPAAQLLDKLQNAFNESHAREQREQERMRLAEQQRKKQEKLLGGIRRDGASSSKHRPGGRPRPR